MWGEHCTPSEPPLPSPPPSPQAQGGGGAGWGEGDHAGYRPYTPSTGGDSGGGGGGNDSMGGGGVSICKGIKWCMIRVILINSIHIDTVKEGR